MRLLYFRTLANLTRPPNTRPSFTGMTFTTSKSPGAALFHCGANPCFSASA